MGRTKTEILMTTVALLIHIEASVVAALRIDVKSGSTKCIKEEMQLNTMTIGKYAVVNPFMDHPVPDTHKITVRVCL